MRLKKPAHATVIAYVALFFAMGGTAVAATGGTFVLGRSNSATTTTVLTNSGGAALTLNSKAGTAPFTTNSTTKVGRLNADLVDGLDSLALQRKLASACAVGRYVRAISQSGAVTCETATTKVIQVDDLIDTTGEFAGEGVAACPTGYAIVSGGYDLTDDAGTPLGVAVPAWAYPESSSIGGANLYRVKLITTTGEPYTGGGIVFGVCVLGASVPAPETVFSRTSSMKQAR